MNTGGRQNDGIEQVLKRARPAGPSEGLKSRVLGAAGEAWTAHPSALLWRIALRRLAVSAAAAVFLVVLANIWSDSAVTQSRMPRPIAVAQELDVRQQWADGDPEIPYGALLGHMAAVCRPAAVDPRAMIDYVQSLRDALDQTNENGSFGNES